MPPRRNFFKLLLAGLTSSFLYAKKPLNALDHYERDRFGGWTGKQFEASGFFRTEFDGKRWWLVTPEGNAFITFGVNHYHASWWTQDHNRAYWNETFGAKNSYDANWNKGFRNAALKDLKRLGINTLGIHTDAPMLTEPPGNARFPYVAEYTPLKLSHYLNPSPESYMDIFSQDYVDICEQTAKAMVAPYANDPMILGFCMSDCPLFTDGEAKWYNGTTFPRQIRNLGSHSPGKRIYVQLMSKLYQRITDFNRVYQTQFNAWEDLSKATHWRDNLDPQSEDERRDNAHFLELCVDQYYKTAKLAFKRHNPNHLFLGDKLNGNSDGLDAVIKITSRYTDLINFQYYDSLENQAISMQRWSETVSIEQPLLNGDSAFTVPTETMPKPFGPHCSNQEERAKLTLEYMKQSLARNDFVGWHMCGIIDTTKCMPGKEDHQHQGLMTTHGEYYPAMEESVQKISSQMYAYALK
jgi:hypothetical protein